MSRFPRVYAASLTLAIAGASLVVVSPSAAADDTYAVTPDIITVEASFRQDLGFRADEDWIRDVHDDQEAVAAATEYGAAFTTAERSELDVRQALVDLAPRIRDYFANYPNSFGDFFLDNATGTLRLLLLGPDTAVHLNAIRAMSSTPDRILAVPAQFTAGQLTATFDAVSGGLETLADAGLPVVDVNLDTQANRVIVGVTSPLSAGQRSMLDEFGVGVDVAQFSARPALTNTADRKSETMPMKAGVEIYTLNWPGYIVYCTSAFGAYYDTTDFLGRSTRHFVQLTAGHCGRPNYHWVHNNNPVGSGSQNPYDDASTAVSLPANWPKSDSEEIVLDIGTKTTNKVLLDTTSVVKSYRSITSTQAASADVVGENTCFAGVTTGNVACGTLQSRSYTVTYHDDLRDAYVTIYNQRLTTPMSKSGDSGGPVWYGNQAKGIMSGARSDGKSIYSHIQYAQSETGTHVLTYNPS